MIRYLLASALILIASDVAAERIRDMSLSMEESLRQPDIHTSEEDSLGSPWSNQYDSFPSGDSGGRRADLQAPYLEQNRYESQSFMANYCDTNVTPIVQNRHFGDTNHCFESTKAKACDGFKALPDDAKNVLDRATECAFAMSDDVSKRYKNNDCEQLERDQFRLAKKYWNSQEMTYLVLFLPDMVANPMIFCAQR